MGRNIDCDWNKADWITTNSRKKPTKNFKYSLEQTPVACQLAPIVTWHGDRWQIDNCLRSPGYCQRRPISTWLGHHHDHDHIQQLVILSTLARCWITHCIPHEWLSNVSKSVWSIRPLTSAVPTSAVILVFKCMLACWSTCWHVMTTCSLQSAFKLHLMPCQSTREAHIL